MSSTIAIRAPVRRLNSALLPTLGRPTMATIGRPPRALPGRCPAWLLCFLPIARSSIERLHGIGLVRDQLAHARAALGPAFHHLDPELHEHLALEQPLHLDPRLGADLLQPLPTRADHDRLLRFLLDHDGR